MSIQKSSLELQIKCGGCREMTLLPQDDSNLERQLRGLSENRKRRRRREKDAVLGGWGSSECRSSVFFKKSGPGGGALIKFWGKPKRRIKKKKKKKKKNAQTLPYMTVFDSVPSFQMRNQTCRGLRTLWYGFLR